MSEITVVEIDFIAELIWTKEVNCNILNKLKKVIMKQLFLENFPFFFFHFHIIRQPFHPLFLLNKLHNNFGESYRRILV